MFSRFLIALCLLAPMVATAHDIPNDVTVQAFLKPEGQKLHFLVRVPLKAMRDVVFPERKGYLDLDRVDPLLNDAAVVWIVNFVDLQENEVTLPKPVILGTRISLESDKSFLSYETALAHMTAPKLSNDIDVVWNQTLLDVQLEYPIHSDRSEFSIHPAFSRLGLRVVTVLRFLLPDGAIRAYEYTGDPGLVRIDPHWYQAAWQFVQEGFFHILDGTDHLLFLLCLVIPFRKFRALIPVVTAFTVAHSITLIASAYNLGPDALWFPPLIETLIAISILYMALENVVGASTVQRRWVLAFAFGLVHGFGFSFALRETLQFAGSHLLTSLLSFNIGVELGQILVLVVLIPALEILFRHVVAERMGTIILSALVAHTAWHWMTERAQRLRQFQFQWPDFNAALVVSLMRYAMAVVFLAGLVWLVSVLLRQWEHRRAAARPSPAQITSF
jgi:hypothetical protein